jgi:hypothetical protein
MSGGVGERAPVGAGDIAPADAVRIAAEAKTKVLSGGVRGGAHAAIGLSVVEIVSMARVLDALLIDAFPAPRGR